MGGKTSTTGPDSAKLTALKNAIHFYNRNKAIMFYLIHRTALPINGPYFPLFFFSIYQCHYFFHFHLYFVKLICSINDVFSEPLGVPLQCRGQSTHRTQTLEQTLNNHCFMEKMCFLSYFLSFFPSYVTDSLITSIPRCRRKDICAECVCCYSWCTAVLRTYGT